MTAFYSEHDPYAAQYLRNLIMRGLIAPGIVDERDLQDIEPYELMGFTQVHLCAGIGIWSGALRAAGWPDSEPIWTGSFPCQPFSQAGQRKGIQDERHLWPVGLNLIAQCRPSRFAGEQVASKDGREWLDTVSANLEALDFAFGASDLCAAGFQQAHLRQRNYFAGLADDDDTRLEGRAGMPECGNKFPTWSRSMDGRLEYPDVSDIDGRPSGREQSLHDDNNATVQGNAILHSGKIASRWYNVDWLLTRNPAGDPSWRPVEPGTFPLAHGVPSRMGKLRAYGNALDWQTAKAFCEVLREICGIAPQWEL